MLGAFTEPPCASDERASGHMDETMVLEASQLPAKEIQGATEGMPDDQPRTKKFKFAPPSSPLEPQGQEQPPQKSAQDPVDPENLQRQIPPDLMLHARENFARAHGKELEEVTIEQVIMSREGIVHWVVVNTPLLAQSAQSQVCMRALDKRPIEKAIYSKLDPEVRKRFREEWYATGRTWNFVSLKRFKINTLTNTDKTKGKYCNWPQLCNKFGGAENKEAQQDATLYACAMEKHGYPYCAVHPVTKKTNWLFVDKSLECTSSEDLQGVRVGNNARSLDWQLR